MLVEKKHSIFVATLGLLRVLGHSLKVLWVIYWQFEKMGFPQREAYLQQWARRMLNIMRVDVLEHGEVMRGENCLRASNHVSWLDIVVLYACKPCRFIAKAEVSRYPIIGRIARNAGTLFLDRSSMKDAIRISEQIAEALKQGNCIAFFPEATTSEGYGLLPLHPSLFESALRAGAYVQTVVLRFHSNTSTRAVEYAAYVKTSLIGTLWNVLRHENLHVTVTCKPPFKPSNSTRHLICKRVTHEMEAVLGKLNYNSEASAHAKAQEQVAKLEDDLQSMFLTDAKYELGRLKEYVSNLIQAKGELEALKSARELVNMIKFDAKAVGFVQYAQATEVLVEYVDGLLKAKKEITTELLEFLEDALATLQSYVATLDVKKDATPAQIQQMIEKVECFKQGISLDDAQLQQILTQHKILSMDHC